MRKLEAYLGEMSEGLKRIDENLSRSWKVDRTHEPFYDGKKGMCNKSLTKYYSLYSDNLLVLKWPSGTHSFTHSLTHSFTHLLTNSLALFRGIDRAIIR